MVVVPRSPNSAQATGTENLTSAVAAGRPPLAPTRDGLRRGAVGATSNSAAAAPTAAAAMAAGAAVGERPRPHAQPALVGDAAAAGQRGGALPRRAARDACGGG